MGLNIQNNPNTVIALVPDTANPGSLYYKKEVREAVDYVIDREALAKAFSYGYWKPVYQIPAETSPAYNPDFTLALKPSC